MNHGIEIVEINTNQRFMKYFIIGDVHGSYFTMLKMLDHWNAQNEKLIILGDFINKGKNTLQVLSHLFQLQHKHPNQVIILKGNNEYLFEKYYRKNIKPSILKQFRSHNLNYINTLYWLNQLAHFKEFNHILVSHAGVYVNITQPLNQADLSLLFSKEKLRDIGKVQFLGHRVVEEAYYDKKANAWYMDTGAGNGDKLTGAKVTDKGEIENFIVHEVDRKDIP